MAVDIIQGTDREFVLRIIKKSTEEPYDLTGLVGSAISLKLPGEAADIELTLIDNGNASLLEIISALGGKIKVTLSDADTALLKKNDGQSMELTIKEGGGPDYLVSKVQFIGALNVKPSLFE
jgi:hypothetical protein